MATTNFAVNVDIADEFNNLRFEYKAITDTTVHMLEPSRKQFLLDKADYFIAGFSNLYFNSNRFAIEVPSETARTRNFELHKPANMELTPNEKLIITIKFLKQKVKILKKEPKSDHVQQQNATVNAVESKSDQASTLQESKQFEGDLEIQHQLPDGKIVPISKQANQLIEGLLFVWQKEKHRFIQPGSTVASKEENSNSKNAKTSIS